MMNDEKPLTPLEAYDLARLKLAQYLSQIKATYVQNAIIRHAITPLSVNTANDIKEIFYYAKKASFVNHTVPSADIRQRNKSESLANHLCQELSLTSFQADVIYYTSLGDWHKLIILCKKVIKKTSK